MSPQLRLSEGPGIMLQVKDEMSKQKVSDLLTTTAELHKLHKRKIELQSVPFQTRWEAGAELGSIVLCAAAGGLSASLHYTFLSLFGVAFWVYRRSTASIRARQAAHDELQEVNKAVKQAARAVVEAEVALANLCN